jgi:hypothetical protein
LSELPPQRRPTSVAPLAPPVHTLEPLSPAPTTAAPPGLLTKVWQKRRTCEPWTLVFTHVRSTRPCVQPVVRPILFTVAPTDAPAACAVIATEPAIVRLPLFGPDVAAIEPRVEATPDE